MTVARRFHYHFLKRGQIYVRHYGDRFITFESSSVSGAPLNKVSILYYGPEEMGFVQDLALDRVRPVLANWGYDR